METKDAVDEIVDQWRQQRPDLDPSAKEITGRIIRLASLFQQAYRDAFAGLGLNDGDYGVLAALRRDGEPYELTPTELARHQMMTSGGMTAAIDRLEHKQLVMRTPNPSDRRGSLVRLTTGGLAVIDEAMTRHTRTEHDLIAVLDPAEHARLSAALHKLLCAVDIDHRPDRLSGKGGQRPTRQDSDPIEGGDRVNARFGAP